MKRALLMVFGLALACGDGGSGDSSSSKTDDSSVDGVGVDGSSSSDDESSSDDGASESSSAADDGSAGDESGSGAEGSTGSGSDDSSGATGDEGAGSGDGDPSAMGTSASGGTAGADDSNDGMADSPGAQTDDGSSGDEPAQLDDAPSGDIPGADDSVSVDPNPGNDGASGTNTVTTTYYNCLECAQDECTSDYDACMANATCSSFVACLEACWNDDDWERYEECSDACILPLAGGVDPEAEAIGVAIGYCMEDRCDDSQCLTVTVEREEDFEDDPFGGPAEPVSLEPVVEVEADGGYLVSGPWHGYLWTEVDDQGSSIEILDHAPGEPLCIAATVELSSPEAPTEPGDPIVQEPTYVKLGFNLNQAQGEPAPAPEPFSFEGLAAINLNEGVLSANASYYPSRFELWPAGADSDPSLRICTDTVLVTGRVSLGRLENCDDESYVGLGELPPIESLVLVFESYAPSQQEYCIYNLQPR